MTAFWTSFYAVAFAAILAAAVGGWPALPLAWGPIYVDALAAVMAPAIALLAWVVLAFARRYMQGERGRGWFQTRLALLVALVLALLVADSSVLLVAIWAAMGWLLGGVLATNRAWPQARAAARLARRWFLAGAIALAAAAVWLFVATGSASLQAVAGQADSLSPLTAWGAGLLVIAAAGIQSALVPAHLWLTSSLTAPTPVSAVMHAGLVNAGGLLVARFAGLLGATPGLFTVLVVLGGVSAFLASLTALVQTDIKRALAHSTVAQMGFMIVQAGLGFFGAALAHLLLHGLFKASLFLGAGKALNHAKLPDGASAAGSRLSLLAGLIGALLAGLAFAAITGKGTPLHETGSVLVVFAALAAAQIAVTATRSGDGGLLRAPVLLAGLPLVGVLYGSILVALQGLLAPMGDLTQPQPLGAAHIGLVLAFIVAWLAVVSGWAARSPRAYALVLALGQPARSTVSTWRGAYHV